MSINRISHFNIVAAKDAYANGKNITELLRTQKGVENNTPEIIEMAYDLQAGTYISGVRNNPVAADRYTSELAEILDGEITKSGCLLDIGTGELTTLSLVVKKLKTKHKKIMAFDISWSRLFKGLHFAKETMAEDVKTLSAFCADISEIPLRSKSIDYTISSHALEPNGGKLKELLTELFRITKTKLILFEPCYEINSSEGKERMDMLGYVKNIEKVAEQLGGSVLKVLKIKNVSNLLNPTACFVIIPPDSSIQSPNKTNNDNYFTVPGTDYGLVKIDSAYFSRETGLCYPVLKSIPILRSNSAILASSLLD